MDAEIKRKWIEALRSGEFKQARGKLRKDDGYCCLGVLCMVAEMPINKDGHNVIGQAYGYDPIWKLTGDELVCRHLSQRNDDGASFSEIADIVEQKL